MQDHLGLGMVEWKIIGLQETLVAMGMLLSLVHLQVEQTTRWKVRLGVLTEVLGLFMSC